MFVTPWLFAAISRFDHGWIYIKETPDKESGLIIGSSFFSATQTGRGGRGNAGRITREFMLYFQRGVLHSPAWQSNADPTAAAVGSPKIDLEKEEKQGRGKPCTSPAKQTHTWEILINS